MLLCKKRITRLHTPVIKNHAYRELNYLAHECDHDAGDRCPPYQIRSMIKSYGNIILFGITII